MIMCIFLTIKVTEYPLNNPLIPSFLYSPAKDDRKFSSLTLELKVTQANRVRATSNGNVKVIALALLMLRITRYTKSCFVVPVFLG